jgi:hypothetical protein
MVDARNLSTASLAYQQLKAMLIENEGLAEDEQTLADTLEGATDLQDLCILACRDVEQTDADIVALDLIIADKQARKRRFEDRRSRIRQAVAEAMLDAGLKRIVAADMTIFASVSKGGVRIVNDDLLPDGMTVTTRRPDKAAIKAAIDAGQTVPGAERGNGTPTIRIATK